MSSSTDGHDVHHLLSWWPDTLPVAQAADVMAGGDLGQQTAFVSVVDDARRAEARVLPWTPEAREALAGVGPWGTWTLQDARDGSGDNLSLVRLLHCDGLDADHPLPGATVEELVQLDGFTIATLGDIEDARWQSETSVQNYRVFGRPYEHLPRTTDRRGRERVDVSGNPGRISFTVGLRMWAGSDLWFGPDAGRVMDYARVASIPVGRLRELPNERYHLHLFDLDEPVEAVREKQAALRAHLGWDRLEAEADARVAELRAARG